MNGLAYQFYKLPLKKCVHNLPRHCLPLHQHWSLADGWWICYLNSKEHRHLLKLNSKKKQTETVEINEAFLIKKKKHKTPHTTHWVWYPDAPGLMHGCILVPLRPEAVDPSALAPEIIHTVLSSLLWHHEGSHLQSGQYFNDMDILYAQVYSSCLRKRKGMCP